MKNHLKNHHSCLNGGIDLNKKEINMVNIGIIVHGSINNPNSLCFEKSRVIILFIIELTKNITFLM